MPRHPFTALLVFLGLGAGPALARDLQVEVEVLHVGGLLAPAELEALLADARLRIEAVYLPTRLIAGVTASRSRTMPIGSRLDAIPRALNLNGTQVERHGRRLRFLVPDIHPEHPEYYRLHALALRTPVAPGTGRPQPDLHIHLLNPVPKTGAEETARYLQFGAFDLGLRLRHRWSDARSEPTVVATPACPADIQSLGNGQYRFRPRHRVAGLFEFLAPVVHSDPPPKPPAGQRSRQLRAPFPEPLAGWQLSRNHLLQVQVAGQAVERLSVYAEQAGPGPCRRTRGYEALFAGGQIVAAERSVTEYGCGAEGGMDSHTVTTSWLDDASLARHTVSTPKASHSWDAFTAATAPVCAVAAPPPTTDVQALVSELQRIRAAFLRP